MQVIEKVISGMCVGSDTAGSRAAKKLGIPTGGWDYKGHGDPEYGVKGMEEHPFLPHDRTTANVIDGDVTIHVATASEMVTLGPLDRYHKPYYEVRVYKDPKSLKWAIAEDEANDLREWLVMARMLFCRPLVINIAGDAKKDMEPLVEEFLTEVLTPLWEYATVGTS